MTSPAPDPVRRANWLGRYLSVEKKFDSKLRDVLLDSLSGIDEAFENLGDKFSDKVRRVQLSQSNRALRKVIGSIYRDTDNLIRKHRQDAAMAAVDAALYDQRSILSSLFPDPVARRAYADSLRQTGRRNIEAVAARVLDTEKPLSARVYNSEALANGLVSRTINRALARGDSAANLARDVRDLIDPSVPGGVSYAAKRLGRTEINNAFHAQSIYDAQESPWVKQMRWHLSKTHEIQGCDCEKYFKIGLFPIDAVPEKPHPNCRCFVTPELPDYADFESDLLAGEFDDELDKLLGFDEDGPIEAAESIIEAFESDPGFTPRVRAAYEKARETGKDIYPDRNWSAAERRTAQKITVRMQDEKFAAETAPPPPKPKPKRVVDDSIPESIEAAENPTQVQNWLTNSYEGLEVTGFDTEDVDLRSAKEIASAFEELQKAHPDTAIRALRVVDDLPPEESAMTRYNLDGEERADIVFNRKWVSDYEGAQKRIKDAIDTGFLSQARDPEKPWHGTVVHEWGHVLDFSSRSQTHRGLMPLDADRAWAAKGSPKVGRGMYDAFLTGRGYDLQFDDIPDLFDEYDNWVLDSLPSGYSFKDKRRTKINAVEAVAEAYTEAVLNPDANEFSKALRDKLIEAVRDNRRLFVGVHRRE